MSMIKRIFVANRGEIARRIAVTARRLGIETAAIYDQATPPLYLAEAVDVLIPLRDAGPTDFLNMEKMIALAKAHGCNAIHPGYGFLSENTTFAQKVGDAGLIWIGPNPQAIDKMASKARARDIAVSSQVPCLPALEGLDIHKDPDAKAKLTQFAKTATFPLLVKAAYGGGGKGMRMVEKAEDLITAAERAASEAVNAFGNGLLIVEPYVTAPRHVEVQIIADKHGYVAAVGDRDCSVQRRHQKIIEESPAPDLTPDTRAAMAEAAVKLAKAVGYDSVGTIEFLVDWSPQFRNIPMQKFYFLEMNTRLQVDHPVTEEVHKIDLVEVQIVAASQGHVSKLPWKKSAEGHSVEVRVYAEDCAQNFLPAPGPIARFTPFHTKGVRWESGIDSVDVVTPKFDPMVAKLVATADSRPAALALMNRVLEGTVFHGPANNIEFLHAIMSKTPFVEGAVTTGFLKEQHQQIADTMTSRRSKCEKTLHSIIEHEASGRGSLFSGQASGLTNASASVEDATMRVFGKNADSPSDTANDKLVVYRAAPLTIDRSSVQHVDFIYQTSKDSQSLIRTSVRSTLEQTTISASMNGVTLSRMDERETTASGKSGHHSSELTSPVPGKVVAVKVKSGDHVEAGTVLFVLESMKMEFEVKAGQSGTIDAVRVQLKEQVGAGATLASWKQTSNS